jgi:hypothetical protein
MVKLLHVNRWLLRTSPDLVQLLPRDEEGRVILPKNMISRKEKSLIVPDGLEIYTPSRAKYKDLFFATPPIDHRTACLTHIRISVKKLFK